MVLDKEMIAEIKNSVNIVEVIGEAVSLSKAGRNYLGLCPFHKEKTPSFNVIEDRQFFHCFGCGKSGDVFKFIEEYRQVSFLESVKIIAERSGITLQLETPSLKTKQVHPHQNLFDIHQDAAKFYHAVLMTTRIGQSARDYLYQRGLTDDMITYFNIGLAPDESDYLYQSLKANYPEETIADSGLFNIAEQTGTVYDAFRNRIMFPLTDDQGRTVAFSGRIWTEQADSDRQEAKYKNSRSTLIFNKSYELYHLDKAKAVISKQHEVYVMEGFMDVIAAYRAGTANAVASMGTALTAEHISHLKKFTKKVILTYDGDRAGQNAIAKALELLKDLSVEIVRIPNQMDPDEFSQQNSPEELQNLLVNSRISSAEFLIQHLKPENTDNLQSEIAYVEQIAKIIAQTPSITAQNTYINIVADLLPDFDYLQIEQAVNSERLAERSQLRQNQTSQTPVQTVNLPLSKRLTALVKTESQLLHRLLHHDYLLSEYRNKEEFSFETEELEALYQIVKKQGEITDLDLAQMTDHLRQVYYQMLEENLPDDIAPGEIADLENKRARLLKEQELQRQSKRIRESSNHGDVDDALKALENLIAQKRQME
ncbi:DNA primase [Streptococcus chenjunshii]|uniref:DNA primase n=2 Tax=Streptococcus chenjunshii TaxID=2173853 RepID=A0A372KJZ2_9STRE|nr:DNA primase [Streptococcus chenjunshii]RFU50009.1 DNA primase [Streptococcus chenjunshii]RFU52595.1 DNA primase [Streptococcus chenjunshii]